MKRKLAIKRKKKRFAIRITALFLTLFIAMYITIPTLGAVPAFASRSQSPVNMPENLREMVDEVYHILRVYSPEHYAMMQVFTTADRPNLPIGEYHIRLTYAAFDSSTGRLLPEYSRTMNEFIADFSCESASIFGNLRSVSHYLAHQFFDVGADSSLGYIIDGRYVAVYHLPSNKIVRTETSAITIPPHLRTQNWAAYTQSPGRANSLGAFGLLEEFMACYIHTRVVNNATDYVINRFENEGFCAYLMSMYLFYALEFNIFYDFLFWITHHMLYLRDNHKNQFVQIVSNEEFITVFSYVYTNYRHLIYVTAPNNVQRVFDSLTSMRVTHQYDDGYFTFYQGSWRINSFNPTMAGVYDARNIMLELQTPRYTEMIDFLLSLAPSNRSLPR